MIFSSMQHVLHLLALHVWVHTVLVATILDQHVLMATADVPTTHRETTVPVLVSYQVIPMSNSYS